MNKYSMTKASRIKVWTIAIFTLLGFLAITPAFSTDVKASKDHPLIPRFKDSEITYYKLENFNEYALLTNAVTSNKGLEGNPDSVTELEGRITWLFYRNPAKSSSLEVFRNYEKSLKETGFEILFSCKTKACGGYQFNRVVTGHTHFIGSDGDQRYLAAKLTRDKGDVYVSLYVASANVGGGPNYGRVLTQLRVIEVESMEDSMVTIDASEMAKGIGDEGRIALYGILFDTDKATIKAESKPTLEQISDLLNSNTKLKLVIVGHTDNQGDLDYNMDLSKRRARSVEDTLVNEYKISAERLSSWGVGYLSPVASNRDEAGRAKNRRVELVEK